MGQRWLLLPRQIITNNSSQGLASLIRGNYLLISVTFLLDLSMGSFVGPAIFLFYILKSKSIHYGEYKICMSFVGIFGYLKILFYTVFQTYRLMRKLTMKTRSNITTSFNKFSVLAYFQIFCKYFFKLWKIISRWKCFLLTSVLFLT